MPDTGSASPLPERSRAGAGEEKRTTAHEFLQTTIVPYSSEGLRSRLSGIMPGRNLQKFPGLPAGGSDISHVTPSYVPSSFPGRIAAPLQSNSPFWGGAACLDDHGAQGRSTVFSKINGYPPLQRKPRCSRGTGILRKWRGFPSYYAPDPGNTGHSAIFPGLAVVQPEFISAAV